VPKGRVVSLWWLGFFQLWPLELFVRGKAFQMPVSERQIIPVITCICIHIPPIYKNSFPVNGIGVVRSER